MKRDGDADLEGRGMWWRKASTPKSFSVPRVEYVGEQDGPPERQLKAALTEWFQRAESVQAAYLLRVRLAGAESESVLLGLVAPGADPQPLVQGIGGIFQQHFARDVFLDITLLSDDEAARADAVASPFYRG